MKSLNLFPKTFLYTLALMTLVTSVALGTTYLLGTNRLGGALSVSLATVPALKLKDVAEYDPDAAPAQVAAVASPMETTTVVTTFKPAEIVKNEGLVEGEATQFPEKPNVVNATLNADTAVAIPYTSIVEASPHTVQYGVSMDFVKDTASLHQTVEVPTQSYSIVRFDSLVGSAIVQALPWVVVICLAVSVLCALFFSRIIALPIRRISAETERMATLAPDAMCPVTSRDEIGVLAAHVNGLYAGLRANIEGLAAEKAIVEATERSKIDFLRSASHELKTPVTALSVMLENMSLGIGKYQDHAVYLPRCEEMAQQLSQMICDILEASRAPSLAPDEPAQSTQWAEFLPPLCAPYAPEAEQKQLAFLVQATGEATFPPALFGRVVTNLLRNATSYTPAGGQIIVTATEKIFSVTNDCVPLSAADLSHIFEPFYRPDWARGRATGGNGLGLYIVANSLRSMGFSYTFLPTEDEMGLCFTVYLR